MEAVNVMMGDGDEKNAKFHDFFGNASPVPPPVKRGGGGDGEMEVEGSTGLTSEVLGANNSEVFHFHGRKNVSEPEASNSLSGRKRSINASSSMSLIRERMLPIGSDYHENSRVMKTFGKEIMTEQLGQSHEPYSMQRPQPTSVILRPPITGRNDSFTSKWEYSVPMPGYLVHSSSRFGQSAAHIEKLSSSSMSRDVNVGTTIIAQAAADEGSRTGQKRTAILDIINSSGTGVDERSPTGAIAYSNRPKAPHMVEPESSNVPSQYNLAYPSRQMTIFYAGQAHVFDDVHPNKADVIMALAGSSGVSWSTNCFSEAGTCPPISKPKDPCRVNEPRVSNLPVPRPGVSDRRFASLVAGSPHTQNHQTLTPDQGLMSPVTETDTGGERDA